MDWDAVVWSPGSFTKNLAFGQQSVKGLALVREAITSAFKSDSVSIDRDEARASIANQFDYSSGQELVIVNFFLWNEASTNSLVADRFVNAAFSNLSDEEFDALALAVLAISRVGRFKKARDWQRYPSPWFRELVFSNLNLLHAGIRIPESEITRITESDKLKIGGSRQKFFTNLRFFARNLRKSSLHLDLIGELEPVIRELWTERLRLAGELQSNSSPEVVQKALREDGFFEFVAKEPPITIDHSVTAKQLGPNKNLKKTALVTRTVRNPKVRNEINNLYKRECQFCGEALVVNSEGRRYSEACHIKPISLDGPDDLSNVLSLCPNHHKILDWGGIHFLPDGQNLEVIEVYSGKRHFVVFHDDHGLDPNVITWYNSEATN